MRGCPFRRAPQQHLVSVQLAGLGHERSLERYGSRAGLRRWSKSYPDVPEAPDGNGEEDCIPFVDL